MKRAVGRTLVVAAVAAAGAVAIRQSTSRSRNGTESRWHAVTVNRPPEVVAPEGRPPEPLARLGDRVEVRTRPAPGDRGTELLVRLRGAEPSGLRGAAARIAGQDPRQELRSALRQAKQLLETGEILQADTPPSTRRTLPGLPVDLTTRRAGGEGRL
jgi:hypothetical protein